MTAKKVRFFHVVQLLVACSLLESLRRFQTARLRTSAHYFGFERVTVDSMATGRSNGSEYRRQMKHLLKIIITEYTDWHREQHQLSLHNTTHAQTVPKLIYTGRTNNYGLGDVIRGLIHSYLCAVASKRMFFLNLTEPFPISTVLVSPPGYDFIYHANIFGPRDGEEQNKPVYFRPSGVNMDQLELLLSDTISLEDLTQKVLDWDLFLEIPNLYPDLELSKKLSIIADFRPTREEVMPFILKALFRPSAEYRRLISIPVDSLNPWSPRRFFRTDNDALHHIARYSRFLSIHARLGYGAREASHERFNLESRNVTLEDIGECLAQMATELANQRKLPKPHHFFLSTDTKPFRTVLKRKILRVNPRARVYHTLWPTVHLRFTRGRSTPGKLKNYKNTYMDLYLLSKGDSMLFIRSGFAHAALWMGAMTSFVGIQLDNCLRVLNGSSNIKESMRDAVSRKSGFHTDEYRSQKYRKGHS